MSARNLIQYRITVGKENKTVRCIATYKYEKEICKCEVYTDNARKAWTISSWFTQKGYEKRGIGYNTLRTSLYYFFRLYGCPEKIEYIWNGENEYVLDWMTRHFNAACKCPIAIQKTQMDDDWLSHIYELDVIKVMEYFHIKIA